jgi:predicted MPP superfamily phosphohydrolase
VLDLLCKQVSNAAQTINAPFWFVAWFGLHRYVSFQSALVVNAVGFACWLGLLALVILVRRWLLRPRTPAAVARPESADADRSPASPSRRAFLTDSVIVAGAACSGVAGVYSTFVTPWSLSLVRHRIPIPNLPHALDGIRLVQLTDTHLGPRIPASFIRQAVDMAIGLDPDLFVLTGDYVHMGRSYIEPAAALFKPLSETRAGRLGVIGVIGNHDHYADAGAVRAALAGVGVRVLHNQRLFLDESRGLARILRTDASLCIAGVDDLLEGTPDLRESLGGVPDDVPRVLLSHNPDYAEDSILKAFRADLMISGHTHGGQVRLPVVGSPLIPSRFGQKYAHGLVRGPHCPVLVGAGVGMSLLPVRVGVDPEVVEITLTRA